MEPREVADRYTAIAEGLDARVAGCTTAAWGVSTPCPEWTVRDILEHVVGVHRSVLALLDDPAADPEAGEDAAAAWKTVTAAVRQALPRPGTGDPHRQPTLRRHAVRGPGGRWCAATPWCTPGTSPGPPVRTSASTSHGGGGVDVDAAGRRHPAHVGAFGPAVEPPAGADTQTKLLCFLGRTV